MRSRMTTNAIISCGSNGGWTTRLKTSSLNIMAATVLLLLIFGAAGALFLTIFAATSPVLLSFILQFRLQKEPSILKSGNCDCGGVVGRAVAAAAPILLLPMKTSASQQPPWRCCLLWWLPSSSSTEVDIGLLMVNTLFVDDTDDRDFLLDVLLTVILDPHPLSSSSPPLYPLH